MAIVTTTHLNFRGDARAALEFYQSAFGGNVTLITYKDAQIPTAPAEADQITWGQVQSDGGFHVMAYDVIGDMPWNQGVNSIFVSVRGTSADEITSYWKALADGATIVQDLAPSGWAPLYGMLKDRFGVVWVLDVAPDHNAS
jgi:PhnB protein